MSQLKTTTEATKPCALCGNTAKLVYEKMKGYIEGSSYDIYECPYCEATFVSPLAVDKAVYEYIYKQREIMPGYERYYRYSELVKLFKDPLSVLCNFESVYWAVRESVVKYFSSKKNISILEIGSGLGYLTYSLNQFGYKTIGLDISNDAVRQAREKYGDYYEAGDLFLLAKERRKRYDCVIMTEIIEHVEDPKHFIEAALSMLNEGGKLIVSTPNKSDAPAGVIWQSDIPPVHLWFFSEKSIAYIAEKLGKKCEFVDFTDYTKKFYGPSYTATMDQLQDGLPRLNNDGTARAKASHLKTVFFGLRGRYFLSYIRRRFLKNKKVSKRTTTLCAVIG